MLRVYGAVYAETTNHAKDVASGHARSPTFHRRRGCRRDLHRFRLPGSGPASHLQAALHAGRSVGRAAGRAGCPGRDAGGGHRARHDGRHQRRPGARRRPRRADRHRGLPRPARHRPADAAQPLPVGLPPALAPRARRVALRGERAGGVVGRGRDPARYGGGRRGARSDRRGRGRGAGRLPALLLRQPRPRADDPAPGRGPRAGRLPLIRDPARIPRVRAHLDHRPQRLRLAAHGPLPRRVRNGTHPPANHKSSIINHQSSFRLPHHAILRRHPGRGDGAARGGADAALRAGRRRDRRVPRGRAGRRRPDHHLRHGRHLDRRVAGRRSNPADERGAHRGVARARADDRHPHRRRGRRLDRLGRRGGRAARGAGERRQRAWPGVLRPRRGRVHRDRRQFAAGPARSPALPGRPDATRHGRGGTGRSATGRPVRPEHDCVGRGGDPGGERGHGAGDPRHFSGARLRSARLHPGAVRRRGADARARPGRRAAHRPRADPARPRRPLRAGAGAGRFHRGSLAHGDVAAGGNVRRRAGGRGYAAAGGCPRGGCGRGVRG